ncbi:Zinc finger and SCAN domain-containing protein 20, partial [Apaloderma vittatum]
LECGKSFPSCLAPHTHHRVHREKPFKCLERGKSFANSTALLCHGMTRTKEKP